MMLRLTPPKRAALSWESRSGNQDINGRVFFSQNAGQPYSLQKALTRGGRWRFEASPGDYVLGQTDRIRSELQCSTKEAVNGRLVISDWLKWSTPDGPQTASIGAGQAHQTEDAGPPADFSGFPLYIAEIQTDGLYIWTASVAAASQPTSYGRTNRLSAYSFPADTWHRRVVDLTFGFSNDAALSMWINGSQVLALTGINMGMNDAVGPYYKFGWE